MTLRSKSTLAGLAALLDCVQGARVLRRKVSVTIAGVPVHDYRETEDWTVLFHEGVGDAQIEEFCQGQCKFQGHPGQGGVAFAEIHGRKLLEELLSKRTQDIEILEPDGEVSIIPEMGIQDTEEYASWGLERVGVKGRTNTGKGVHIYVTDTGIRASHSDFDGRVVPTLDMSSDTLVECATADASCSADRQGHGTHCAGSAAGREYGVASEATIHAVKTLGDGGGGKNSWQMAALDWIVTQGEKPAVVSMSLGSASTDPSWTKAIGSATAAGFTVVVAAGNLNIDSCEFSPAFVETAITVGATTSSNHRANYSNYGACNNIFAPGSDIISASHQSDDGAQRMSGTSMACPHVAGAAALLLEANPGMYRDDVLAAMQTSARTDLIGDLSRNDPDVFLWVSGEPAPAPVPTPAPLPTAEPTSAPTPPPVPICIDGCNEGLCWYWRCGACDWCA